MRGVRGGDELGRVAGGEEKELSGKSEVTSDGATRCEAALLDLIMRQSGGSQWMD